MAKIAMFGISPDYVKEMKESGLFRDLGSDEGDVEEGAGEDEDD